MKTIEINGADCKTKEALFDTFSKAFDFPDYFANNWDSFDEIISDLSWIDDDVIKLIVHNYMEILIDASEEDQDTFFDIISHIEEYSGKSFVLDLLED